MNGPRFSASIPAASLLLPLLLIGLIPGRPAEGQTVPSPQEVLGWEMGARFSDAGEVLRYFEVLAEASPRVTLERFGTTPQGRPQVLAILATPEHTARLEEILAANRELMDPDTPEARAREIAAAIPTILWFTYGIHGNEASSSEAAMWTAWDLASTDRLGAILEHAIVLIDPVGNPDGRDRYVQFYRNARGIRPNPDPGVREHREPWPGGRTSHYLFDLNRDWAWATQAETRARLGVWGRWNPHVHVDFHEMSPNSTYFFFPAADPINPIYPEHILDWGARFGSANAAAFDREGWLYFTAESFDLFYPGYGDSWPSLLGAIGMTYEMAGGGSAGELYRREDGTLLSLADRARRHRAAGEATLRTAAEGRTELLEGFARFHRTVDDGAGEILLVPGAEADRLSALADLLLLQGIEVERASRAFSAQASAHGEATVRSDFPAGTLRVRPRQPRGRLAMTLLRPETWLDAEFSYDITAWALPFAYGVQAFTAPSTPDADWAPVQPGMPAAPSSTEPAPAASTVGYLVRPSFEVVPGMIRFLDAGGKARVMADTFSIGGTRWPRGSWFLPTERNPDLAARVRAAGLSGDAVPLSTGRAEGGPDLGSGRSAEVSLPRVLLLGGEGTASNAFGAHWHFLEERIGLPVDVVHVADLARTDLREWDVVIAPPGGVAAVLGDPGFAELERWVRAGGTLVASGTAAAQIGERLAGVSIRDAGGEDESRDERLRRALRTREEREREEWAESVPGTILPLRIDPGHPVSFGGAADGTTDRMFVLSTGVGFEPDEAFESIGWFPEGVRKVSGVISDERLELLDRSSWMVQRDLGRGRLVLFADDPLFRGFWYSGFLPFTNAVLLSPSF